MAAPPNMITPSFGHQTLPGPGMPRPERGLPGRGARPLGEASALADRPAPRTALVVDDEALIRWSVSETLVELGFDVAQAADGASAINVITGSKAAFDVVVLDLRLPDVNDLSLLGRVRELLPAAMVVLMTAFGTAEIVADAQALGVAGILNKPFELAELSRLLFGDAPAS